MEPRGGSTHNSAAIELAKQITFVFGPENLAVHHYEQLFGYAPSADLRALRKRGAIIVMAPTIPDWLCGEEAAFRRGRPLTEDEQARAKRAYGPKTGTAAIYDPETDALVLPTEEVSPDPLHPVLHELGHALTLEQVWRDYDNLRGLLDDLPERIRDHLANGYPRGAADDEVRIRVAEVFAEAYAMVLAGREGELPLGLASALVGILADMSQQRMSSEGNIDPDTGRTATYVPPESMIREGRGCDRAESQPPQLSRAGDRHLLKRRARRWPPGPQ